MNPLILLFLTLLGQCTSFPCLQHGQWHTHAQKQSQKMSKQSQTQGRGATATGAVGVILGVQNGIPPNSVCIFFPLKGFLVDLGFPEPKSFTFSFDKLYFTPKTFVLFLSPVLRIQRFLFPRRETETTGSQSQSSHMYKPSIPEDLCTPWTAPGEQPACFFCTEQSFCEGSNSSPDFGELIAN